MHVAARALVGSVFVYAGWLKAFDRQQMVIAVSAYDVLPRAWVGPVAAALPWIEIGVGLFLLVGLFVRFSAIAATALVGTFIIAMLQAKARGLPIDCGCFSSGGRGDGVGWSDIIRDLPTLAGAAYLAWRPRGPLRLDNLIAEGS